MNKIFTLLLLLLLLPLASALENPKEISKASLEFSTAGTIKATGNVNYVNLHLFAFPKSDYMSAVTGTSTEPTAQFKEELGRQHYLFSWKSGKTEKEGDYLVQKPISETMDYSLVSDIDSRFVLQKVSQKQAFPYTNLDSSLKEYTQATEKIDKNNPEIIKIANNLAEGETDAYKVAFKFARYVNKIMTYDENYISGTQKASIVLKEKKGVCDEYSVLFMALCRAVGLPIRYISGAAYDNIKNEFIPHAWVEVWFPDNGWVSFDATYNEYGWIDPTHIRMQETADSQVSAVRYIWEGGKVSGDQPDIKVSMTSPEKNLPIYLTSEIWAEESKVGFNSYNIIWMKLENQNDFYIVPEAALIKSPEVVSDNQQYVLLEPHSSALIHWIVKLPANLDERYTYTYDIESSVLFGEPKKISFVADSSSNIILTQADLDEKIGTEVEVKETPKPDLGVNTWHSGRAYSGKPYRIKVTAVNYGTSAIPELKMCIEIDCKTIYIGIADEVVQEFDVVLNEVGDNSIDLTFSGQGINDISQTVRVYVKKQTILDVILDWLESLFGGA